MLIKSNFKDYYDSMQSLGVNRDIVYNRYPKTIEGKDISFNSVNGYFDEIVINSRLIYFCGEMFHGLLVSKKNERPYFYKEDRKNQKLCFTLESICKHYELSNNTKRQIQSAMTTAGTFNDKNLEKLKKFACPIVICEGDYWGREWKATTNGSLKDAGFHQLFDAYTVYQELAMYWANQAVPMKPIPEMSDDIKILQHGFDKFSFRKGKQNV